MIKKKYQKPKADTIVFDYRVIAALSGGDEKPGVFDDDEEGDWEDTEDWDDVAPLPDGLVGD